MAVRKKVADVLVRTVLESRSQLYRWLHDNYDQIAPIIASQPRPAWEALAETVGKSSKLKRPSRQGVRKAWLKLEQDMKVSKQTSVWVPEAVAHAEPMVQTIEPETPARSASRRTFAISSPKKEI